MPELPEVESISRKLNSSVAGKTIKGLRFSGKKLRYPVPRKKIVQILENQAITKVFRVAKQVKIATPRGEITFHLGMTGNFSFEKPPHTHLEIEFEEITLFFSDSRRFGYILASTSSREESIGAPDALTGKDIANYLFKVSRKSKSQIKSILLNQNKILGIGNIYSCEILFAAGINPWTASSKLSLDEYELLEEKTFEVLDEAISTAMRDERLTAYFNIGFEVYGREGEECSICGNLIVRKVQNGRSTFYCPSCQR
jgi:formamidopyrimidine-DNA glycosylase